MTQFTTVSLPDAATVSKNFTPGHINYGQNLATWYLAGSSYDANSVLSLSFKPASSSVSRTKVRSRLTIPIMDPVVTTKKIDEIIIEVSASIPKTATLTQRQDARVYLRNFQSNDAWVKAIDNFEGVF